MSRAPIKVKIRTEVSRARLVQAEQAYLLARHFHQQAVIEYGRTRTDDAAAHAAECYMNQLLAHDRWRDERVRAIRAGAA